VFDPLSVVLAVIFIGLPFAVRDSFTVFGVVFTTKYEVKLVKPSTAVFEVV
jgi:ABC-type sulfate transport system permease component